MWFYIFTVVALAAIWVGSWRRYHDLAHPLVIVLPQFIFLYGVVPLLLIIESETEFLFYGGGWNKILVFQLYSLLLILCFVIGVVIGGRGRRAAVGGGLFYSDPVRHRWMYQLSVAFACLGLLSWLFQVFTVGGFAAAYGVGYGAGWADSGYIREMQYLGVLAVLLVYLYRSGRRMRWRDWILIGIAALPSVGHGLLGARRGPTFIIAMVVFFGYYYFRSKKLNVATLVISLLLLGWLLVFLVVNRGDIYLGSEAIQSRDLRSYFYVWTSNEYLLGSAVFRYGLEAGSYSGFRQIAWLFSRFVPTQLWPSVYEDTANFFGIAVNFFENGGVSREGLARVTGWYPDFGSAEGYVGSLWLEFGYFSLPFSMALGFFFGFMWKRATSFLVSRVIYFLALALSLYLVMQNLDAWLFRFLILAVPVWLLAFMLRSVDEEGKWTGVRLPGRR